MPDITETIKLMSNMFSSFLIIFNFNGLEALRNRLDPIRKFVYNLNIKTLSNLIFRKKFN
jgi:hypothetical protein